MDEKNATEKHKAILLNADELAAQLRISLSKAYALMRQGEIPTVRMGRSIRVRQKDVDDFIRRNTFNAFDPEV